MITPIQYFIGRPHTNEQAHNAVELLSRVNLMINTYTKETGNDVEINVASNSQISGKTEGGFRLPDCSQGAPNSAHKEAKGIDIYDPDDKLDDWIDRAILVKFDLYREHPDKTVGWVHLTTRQPKSGCRTFLP